MNMKKGICGICFGIMVIQAPGEMALDNNASLPDYLTYAALNNPGLGAAFNRWRAALERVNQADALPDPTLRYAYFIEEVETRVGPQKQKFGISQMVPWIGTLRLKGAIALEAANAAHEDYQAQKLKLFYEVKKAYYEYYYLYQAMTITEGNIALLKHLESVAQVKYKAGAPVSGVIKAQVELGKLDDRLRSLRDLRGPIAATFNAILNRPPDASLPWPTKPPFAEKIIAEDMLSNLLKDNNPELKRLEKIIAKEEAAQSLAQKQAYPDFMLGLDYIDTAEAFSPTPDIGKDPIVATIAIDLPIWRGTYRDAVKEARSRKEAAIQTHADRENILAADLKMALYRLRDTERKIDLFQNTLIPQAEQALNVTEEAYRGGTVDFLGLIDAQRLLLEFQLDLERALADHEIAWARIEMLAGTEATEQ